MSTALMIIDLIDDLAGPKGRANHCHEQVIKRDLVAKSNQAAAYARVRKIPVIWVRVGFDDFYRDIPPYSPLFSTLKQVGALRLSGPGCQWLPGLEVLADDKVIEKKAISAFAGNALLSWLQQHRCHHLLLGGISSPLAIESTTRQAHDLGFQVTVLQDLCAAPTLDAHLQSMETLQNLAAVSNSTDWMNQ
jgi:nicotinamidase-related amidase